MSRLLQSTSVRLALGYALLFVVSSLLLVGLLWWRTAAYLDREIEAVILADTQAVADRFRDAGLAGAIRTVAERAQISGDPNAIYLLADPALTPVAGNLEAWPLQIGIQPGWHQADMVHNGQVRATRLLSINLPAGFHLVIGRDVQDRIGVRGLVLSGLGWATGGALLLALVGGLLVRRGLLRRVETINRTAAAIVQGDLTQRLPTRGSADEFDELGRTINRMLAQIETLIEGVRNVSNVLAHDLRTPIAAVRARLEDLVGQHPTDAVGAELEQAIAELDQAMAIFHALLRLAEIDSGVRRAGFQVVDPAQPIRATAELFGPAIEAKGIALSVAAPAGLAVDADPALLAQAIANLLDNALKFVSAGGAIAVSLGRDSAGQVVIAVRDTGPGIPEADRAKVTERFYRGDASRGTAGVGLGLSIVAAIARLHGGVLRLGDNGPGLAAELILPAPAAAPGRPAQRAIA